MFVHSAQFYDAIYAWKDYAAEARRLKALLAERQRIPAAAHCSMWLVAPLHTPPISVMTMPTKASTSIQHARAGPETFP